MHFMSRPRYTELNKDKILSTIICNNIWFTFSTVIDIYITRRYITYLNLHFKEKKFVKFTKMIRPNYNIIIR